MNIKFFDWLRGVITVHRERREVNLLTTEGDLLQGGGEEVDQSIFFTRYLHQFHCVTTFLAPTFLRLKSGAKKRDLLSVEFTLLMSSPDSSNCS